MNTFQYIKACSAILEKIENAMYGDVPGILNEDLHYLRQLDWDAFGSLVHGLGHVTECFRNYETLLEDVNQTSNRLRDAARKAGFDISGDVGLGKKDKEILERAVHFIERLDHVSFIVQWSMETPFDFEHDDEHAVPPIEATFEAVPFGPNSTD